MNKSEMKNEEATIEELSLRAWPSFESVEHDGWILRRAEGLTKRANSVIPLNFKDSSGLARSLAFCEEYYGKANLRTTFKLTAFSEPAGLDSFLAEKGYDRIDETSVQTTRFEPELWQVDSRVELATGATDEWLSEAARIKGYSEVDDRRHRRIVAGVAGEKTFALMRGEGGRAVALGFAVLDGGYLSFHDIYVDPAFRRQGLATVLMESLISWGIAAGAEKSFLQVVSANEAAIKLYSKFGFEELYRYWYRVK